MSAPADPNRARTIQGECHDAVTGEAYAVSIIVTSALPAKIPDSGISVPNVTLAAGVTGTVAAKPMGREAAWDGQHRV